MNENIDLTKILMDCPIGWEFYSSIYGNVTFRGIENDSEYPIKFFFLDEDNIEKYGSCTEQGLYAPYYKGECTFFPSKEQRNWNKFIAPWYNGKNEQKSVNKIVSRFKVGDWVVRDDTIAQILDIQEQYYIGLDINGKDFVSSRFLNCDKIHLWTINNAKDGDVLVNGSNIFIFHFINNRRLMGYCHVNMDDRHFYNDIGRNECFCTIDAPVTPSTKEQRDLLFQKMKEAGYKWTTETNTFEKLVEPKFDPKTLKPFDKVLVKDFDETSYWTCNLFSHYNKNKGFYYCSSVPFDVCIPYNDGTKNLVGTNKEAPEFYRYWED